MIIIEVVILNNQLNQRISKYTSRGAESDPPPGSVGRRPPAWTSVLKRLQPATATSPGQLLRGRSTQPGAAHAHLSSSSATATPRPTSKPIVRSRTPVRRRPTSGDLLPGREPASGAGTEPPREREPHRERGPRREPRSAAQHEVHRKNSHGDHRSERLSLPAPPADHEDPRQDESRPRQLLSSRRRPSSTSRSRRGRWQQRHPPLVLVPRQDAPPAPRTSPDASGIYTSIRTTSRFPTTRCTTP